MAKKTISSRQLKQLIVEKFNTELRVEPGKTYLAPRLYPVDGETANWTALEALPSEEAWAIVEQLKTEYDVDVWNG